MTPKTRMLVVLCVSTALTGSGWATQITLASDGNQAPLQPESWTVVVAKDAIPSEHYAAQEFQSLFQRMTGETLPIQATPPQPTHNIFIGWGKEMEAASVGFSVADLGDEELRIRIRPDNIVIAGGRPRGTLYGVYEFFERYCGVRFLTFDHTHVPKPETVTIPCEDHTYTPPFSFRWSYYHENAAHPDFAARLRCNTVTNDEKLGGVTPQGLINHTFYRYINVEKHGKDHPEYFALINGERRLDVGGGGPEPCVSNPEVIQIIADGILADLRANPGRKNISCSQNDNDAYCRCDNCEAINEREGTPMGSNLYLVNKVAEAVEKEFPDVKVGTLSYWYTRKPPKTMKPRDNVQIQLCSIECCTTWPLDNSNIKKNVEFCRDMEEWGKICDDIWVWHYNTNFASYDLPFPNLQAIGPNVRFFQRNNVKGVFMQANGNGNAGEFSELRNYVMSRCLWNPELDSWALTEEFCKLHYGPAAEAILTYLLYIRVVAEGSGAEPGCFGTPAEFGLNAEVAAKSIAYFTKALRKAESPELKARVEKASICAYRALIECGGHYSFEDGKVRLVFGKGHEDAAQRYIELVERHGMTMASERMPAAEFTAQLRQYVDGRPGVRLENGIWLLTFLPGQGGKMVQMRHKPSERELLATWTRGGMRAAGGTFEEWGEAGLEQLIGDFRAEVVGKSVELTADLGDGSSLERVVRLDGDKVRCMSTLSHGGAEPKAYQIKVHPEWDCASTSTDPAIIGVYIKDGDKWERSTQGWEHYRGPHEDLLHSAAGGAYAFFNHDAGFGILQTYDPAQFAEPRLWWGADRHQLNLELITNRVELKQGRAVSYAYTIEHLERAPG